MTTHQLERLSFKWSQLRLLIAALALFIGGTPPLRKFVPIPSGLADTILTICWVVSGVASLYLLSRWMKHKNLFGRKDGMDTFAFFVSVVSGINLGFAGLTGINIGMAISSRQIIFVIVGIIYIWTAFYLQKRWKRAGEKLFH